MMLLKKAFAVFRSEPRLLQMSILIGYSITAREVFNHERPHWVVLVTFLIAVFFELCFSRFRFHRFNSLFPAAIITQSVCFLTYTPFYSFYFLAVAFAILSKSLIHYKGRHIFNPSNFGITVVILLFPNWYSGLFNAFSGTKFIGVYFLISGLTNVYLSKTWDISLSFLVGYGIISFGRGVLFDQSLDPTTYMMILLNPSFLIYAFHMINDPATTPRTRSTRVLYSVFLSFSYVVASYLHMTHASFFILFAISSIVPFIKNWEIRKFPELFGRDQRAVP